jgi:hypothetical protein
MDIENIRNLTPYQDINGLLADWVKGVKNILGGKVVGLYLSGSLSYGGFVLERSDIDLEDAEWLSNSHYQSYLALNLCRILHTIAGTEPGSKKVAAEWTKAIYPQWEDLIIEAEQWKFGMEMNRNGEVIRFIKFSIGKVNEIGILG